MTYTLTSSNPLTNGWAAIGTGHGMLDSDMYIVWNTGEEVILSQRRGVRPVHSYAKAERAGISFSTHDP